MCERHRITTFNARRYWLKLILHQFVGGNAHHAEYGAHVFSDARVDFARSKRKNMERVGCDGLGLPGFTVLFFIRLFLFNDELFLEQSSCCCRVITQCFSQHHHGPGVAFAIRKQRSSDCRFTISGGCGINGL